MQRLEIHLRPTMLRWLRSEAQRLDVPMAEVIRRLVQKHMKSHGT